MRTNTEQSTADGGREGEAAFSAGIADREALLKRLSEEVKRMPRIKGPRRPELSLLAIGLENSARFAESYGSAAARAIREEFSTLLVRQAREIDFPARLSEEEYALILPETGLEGAVHLAGRLVKAMDASDSFRPALEAALGERIDIGEGGALSCSLGIYSYPPEDGPEAGAALRLAEEALSQAQSQGPGSYVIAK